MKRLEIEKKFVYWLCALFFAFLAGTGILLSGVQLPQLKMEVSPPGYPPDGEFWNISIWEFKMFESGWIKCSNGTVILYSEAGERYIFYTDIEGTVKIEYRPEYGKVKIEAIKEGFQGAIWIPAHRFLNLNIVIAFYSIFVAVCGVTVKVVKRFFKLEKKLSALVKSIGYVVSITQIVLMFLATKWFWDNYKNSSTWGFSSVIWGPIEFEHLILLSVSLVAMLIAYMAAARARKEWHWSGVKEEWRYLECKISVLLTLAVIVIVFVILFTNQATSFSPIYSYTLTTFASLIAIVPTVSLTVIGISTSGYSIKLARIYRRCIYFWYLLLIYLIIILISTYGLLYPDKATTTLNAILPILSGYGILYLIPYFLAMMRLLDAKKAIEKLGQQINPKYLIPVMKDETVALVPPPEDPLFPMMEISLKAIEEKDMEMLQLTLEEVVRRYTKILTFMNKLRPRQKSTFGEVTSEAITTGEMRKIVEHFINHLRSLAETAVKEKYERAVVCVIKYLMNFAEETMKYRFIEAFRGDSLPTFQWIYEIDDLGRKCSYLFFWDGAASSLRALSNLSEVAMHHQYLDLQQGIASYAKDLSLEGMKNPYSPKHFFLGIALHSMSKVVQSRIKHGVYDFNVESEIEDFNLVTLEALKKAFFATGQILSRCYEELLAVVFFDFYVHKGEKEEIVAKTIWDVFPFKFLQWRTLTFLIQDRKIRKLRYIPQEYSPKEALKDLINNGLGKAIEQAVLLKEKAIASELCSTLVELSQTFYRFKDEELIKEVCSILREAHIAVEDPEDFRMENIPRMLFAMGYACTFSKFESSAQEVISYLKSLAINTAEKSFQEASMRIAFLIEYLGAAAIDMKSMKIAYEALNATIEFEEYYIKKYGSLPQVNNIDLLTHLLKEEEWKRLGRFEPHLMEEKGWLYRLLGDKIDTQRSIVSDEALDQFYAIYLFRKIPSI
jgi:hypothetical protein